MDLVRAYKARMKETFEMRPPRVVPAGPILENIWRDDEVDLSKFPSPFVHELDGGRYIGTEDIVVMRDPETGWINVGTYRIAVHSERTVGIWISPGKHGRLIREKYFCRNEPWPCSSSPAARTQFFSSARNAEMAEGISEYRLRRRPAWATV